MTDSMTQKPPGWSSVSLGELGGWTGGGTPSKSRPDFWSQGDIPWVSPKDMKVAVIHQSQDQITPAAVEGSATKLLPEGSVLLVTRSAILHHTLPVAKTAVEVTINQDLKALIPNELAEVDFIIAALRRFSQSILNTCRKSGTTVCSIEFPELRKFEIPLPPKNEQRRIVSKIEDLTARSRTAREALEAIPPLLERFRQSVLAAAFRGDLTADWRRQNPDVEPASALLERIRQERRHRWEETELAKMRAKGKEPKNNKWKAKYKEPQPLDPSSLPELPQSWCWAATSELGEVQLGRQRSPKNHHGENMVPYLRAANVTWQGLSLDDVKSMNFSPEEVERFRLLPGDILLGEASGSQYEVGKPGVWKEQIPVCCFQNTLIRMRAWVSEMVPYLYQHYFYNAFNGDFGRASKGTGIHHIGAKNLETWPVRLPPITEQQAIVELLAERLAQIEQLDSAVKSATGRSEKLDQSILAKAFRGELVPQDPNDEPASALLARIRALLPQQVSRKRKKANR